MLFCVRFELEIRGEDVIHQVVQVAALNQPLALIARVHGLPAQLVLWVWYVSLHEVPDRMSHHWHWVHGGEEKQLASLINLNTTVQELTCENITSTYMQRG